MANMDYLMCLLTSHCRRYMCVVGKEEKEKEKIIFLGGHLL